MLKKFTKMRFTWSRNEKAEAYFSSCLATTLDLKSL